VKGLGALYDYVCARLEGYRFAKRGLDLLGDAEFVKNGRVLAIQFHDIAAIGGYQVHIVVDLFKHFGVVHLNALEVRIQDVTDFTDGTAFFLIDEAGWSSMLYFGNGVVPGFEQRAQLSVELGCFFVFGRCAHDDAKVLGLHALDESAQAHLFGVVLDFLGYRDAVIKRGEHQETSGEGDFSGQAGTLGGDGLLGNLDQQLLTLGQHVTHGAVLVGLGLVLHLADADGPFVGIGSYRLDVLRKGVEL